ncbi:hypothetical protein BB560_005145, partial [Smittium megazygosporum]
SQTPESSNKYPFPEKSLTSVLSKFSSYLDILSSNLPCSKAASLSPESNTKSKQTQNTLFINQYTQHKYTLDPQELN